jgi:hypothetical protein
MLFVEGEVGGRVVQAVEEYVGMFQQHQALELAGRLRHVYSASKP